MSISLVDTLMVSFSLLFYAFLVVIYVFRAHELDNLELKLAYVYSGFLIPFTILWITNLLGGSGSRRLITGLPIIVYLIYDLWYRLLSRQKPQHHPDHWPFRLYLCLILLQLGSIMLNWYAYLISQSVGNIVLIGYFSMIAAFSYYQYRYKRKKLLNSELNS